MLTGVSSEASKGHTPVWLLLSLHDINLSFFERDWFGDFGGQELPSFCCLFVLSCVLTSHLFSSTVTALMSFMLILFLAFCVPAKQKSSYPGGHPRRS
ncbi:MAG TPA: hypothetical protein DCE42_23675 [Myxococcales bacterium]|nr:hypothetical protein [Deltaproteobacteria bacterium]MBU52414.1 hypothetical protein [Deltaproteobacteria bacterium]HAA57787.1 hypothetical protein [Myxococcales bacterium]